jgi:3-hydroxybutyryl-CoA dehydrogenase
MAPLPVRREQMGYSFTRLWRVVKKEVLRQIADGYSTAEDIDRAWMMAWGTPFGPCGLMDETGLESILNVEAAYFAATGEESDRPPQFLKDMVAADQKGVATGQGFFTYPDPAFQRPGFLDEES